MKVLCNRPALIVIPRQPFLDWLHMADPTSHQLTLLDLAREPNIYLIPECQTPEDVAEVSHDVCEEIFAEQLDGWYRDTASWPEMTGTRLDVHLNLCRKRVGSHSCRSATMGSTFIARRAGM